MWLEVSLYGNQELSGIIFDLFLEVQNLGLPGLVLFKYIGFIRIEWWQMAKMLIFFFKGKVGFNA